MLVIIALTAAIVRPMHGARLRKTSQRDAVARDPRRDLLGRDRDILLRDRDETQNASIGPKPRRDRDERLGRLETVSRPRRIDRDHFPGFKRDLSESIRTNAI